MNAISPILRPSWNANEDTAGGGAPGKQTTKIIASVVAIIVASIILVIYFTRSGSLSRASLAPFTALGQVTAEETAKLLGNRGRIIVVTQDVHQPGAPAVLEGELKAFHETIKKQPDLTLVGTETVRINPDVPSEQGLSADLYSSLLQKYPDLDAIVSLVGPPSLTRQQIQGLPQKLPKCVAVSLGDAPLRNLFRADVVQVAIVNRLDATPPSAKKPASAREAFEQLFQVVTVDNANSLPF
jgi:hypothetical protein